MCSLCNPNSTSQAFFKLGHKKFNFYLALVGSGYLSVRYILDYRNLSDEKQDWLDHQADQEQLKETLTKEASAVLTENERAGDVVKWIEGSRTSKACVEKHRPLPSEPTLKAPGRSDPER